MRLFWQTTASTLTWRRKSRRQRSLARHLWWLHRRGRRISSERALRWILRTLRAHHSRDQPFVSQVQSQIATMARPQKNAGWLCLWCRVMNGKHALCCHRCGGKMVRSWRRHRGHGSIVHNMASQSESSSSNMGQVPKTAIAETWKRTRTREGPQSPTETEQEQERKETPTGGRATSATGIEADSNSSSSRSRAGITILDASATNAASSQSSCSIHDGACGFNIIFHSCPATRVQQ